MNRWKLATLLVSSVAVAIATGQLGATPNDDDVRDHATPVTDQRTLLVQLVVRLADLEDPDGNRIRLAGHP